MLRRPHALHYSVITDGVLVLRIAKREEKQLQTIQFDSQYHRRYVIWLIYFCFIYYLVWKHFTASDMLFFHCWNFFFLPLISALHVTSTEKMDEIENVYLLTIKVLWVYQGGGFLAEKVSKLLQPVTRYLHPDSGCFIAGPTNRDTQTPADTPQKDREHKNTKTLCLHLVIKVM